MKRTKKLIFGLIVCIMASFVAVYAEDEGWSYENGVLTVWSNSVLKDFGSREERPWEQYRKTAKKLVLRDGIKYVGSYGFAGFEALEEAEFPTGLEEIGERSFYDCPSLGYIKLPNGLKTIGDGAFNACVGAVRVKLPDTLEKIGNSAFMNLPKLTVVTIPEKVEYIGMWAFMGCTSLKQFFIECDIPEYVGSSCFADIDENYTLYIAEKYEDDWLSFNGVREEKMLVYYPEQRIPVYLNNSEICFELDPIIVNGRTLVPMRAVFEALGAKVTWSGETKTATAKKDSLTVTVQIDSDTMRKNNQIISLEAPAMLYYGNTLVPVRAVSEAFGAEVRWSDEERSVYIEMK